MGHCLTCRYAAPLDADRYDELDERVDIECHRMPPQVTTCPDGTSYTMFPAMSAGSWCGEWRCDE